MPNTYNIPPLKVLAPLEENVALKFVVSNTQSVDVYGDLAEIPDTVKFILAIETSTTNEVFEFPWSHIFGGTIVYDCYVEWGDNTQDHITVQHQAEGYHTYESAGTYVVKITGTATSLTQNDANELQFRRLINLGDTGLNAMGGMFNDCDNMTHIIMANGVISGGVHRLSFFAQLCSKVQYVDFAGIYSPSPFSVETIAEFLRGMDDLLEVKGLTNINMAQCTAMNNAFYNCHGPADKTGINSWDTLILNNMNGAMRFANNSGPVVEISGWTMTSMTDANNFMNGSSGWLDTPNYNALLIAWSAQALLPTNCDFGSVKYEGQTAREARALMVSKGWNVTDGGENVTLQFHAATFDLTTYEMLDVRVGTGPVISNHTTSLYAVDYLGIYQEYPIDAPVWSGARVTLAAASVTAKSVIFDFADNWGDASLINIRSIEFALTGVVIPLLASDFTAYATTNGGGTYQPSNAFDTSISKIGVANTQEWRGAFGTNTNQRLTVVFNSEQEFDEIIINNSHNSGNLTVRGVRNTIVTASTDTITDVTYNAAIANSTVLLAGVDFPQHVASDVVDDQTVWASPAIFDKAFADDGTGTLIVPRPYLVRQPAATNLQYYSNDQTDVGWVPDQPSEIIITRDQTGLTGEANTATKLDVTSTFLSVSVSSTLTVTAANTTDTFKLWILKDNDETRFPEIFCGTGDVAISLAHINTKTGDIAVRASSANPDLISVEDAGLWWVLYGQATRTVGAGTSSGLRIRPAFSSTLSGDTDPTVTGNIVVGNAEFHEGKTIEQVRNLGPIYTSGSAFPASAVTNIFDAVNVSDTEGPWYVETELGDDFVDIMSIGGVAFLKTEATPVLDDDFSTGGQSWTPVNKGTGTSVWNPSGWWELNNPSGGTANETYIYKQITGLTNGDDYRLRVDQNNALNKGMYVKAGSGPNVANYYSISNSVPDVDAVFPVPANNMYITVSTYSVSGLRQINSVRVDKVVGASSQLTLTDGTNSVSAAFSNGANKVGVAFDATALTMALNVNGVWSADVPYDGSFGSGTIEPGISCRNLQRHDQTSLADQKLIIDGLM